MGRPNELKTGPSEILVKDVLYGPAGELTQMKTWAVVGNGSEYHTETRSYNARGQLTRLTVAIYGGDDIDLEYRYSGTQNDGLTTQMKDWVSGEEVTYQYDELKRLVSAVTTGPEWGLNFSHDGFGNRTGQSVVKGSGPVSSQSYDKTTNRLTGAAYGYDGSGNLTAMPGPGPGCGMTLTYDALNRVSTVNAGSCGYEKYAYGPENRRMWKWRLSDEKEVVYLYGIGGERLGVYQVTENATTLGLSAEERAVYFGGRRVWTDRTSGLGGEEEEFADRLGSVVWREGTRMSYYPYGEEKGGTTEQGRDKFGTYQRDEVTGLDYAVNRYYGSGLGRFLSVDPYVAPGAMKDPRGWNRYGYVAGDPVNFSDPSGLDACSANYGMPCFSVTGMGSIASQAISGLGGAGRAPIQHLLPKDGRGEPSGASRKLNILGGATKEQGKQFDAAIRRADGLLKGDCAKLFGEGNIGKEKLMSANFVSGVAFEPGTAIVSEGTYATTEVKDGVPTGNVTINLLGHFFDIKVETTIGGQPAIKDWSMGTGLSDNDFRALVLLHELGHLTGKLGDDTNNAELSNAFNQSIMADCFGKKDWRP